jgi:hypothetical protein
MGLASFNKMRREQAKENDLKETEIDLITKKEIMQKLDIKGIKYNPTDKKEILFLLLKEDKANNE